MDEDRRSGAEPRELPRFGEFEVLRGPAEGRFLGTAQWASPEQLGEGTLVGRSDLFSLGLVWWFLLTGRPPEGVQEIINLQPVGNKAKAYQVKQVRNLILKYQPEID